MQARFQVAEAKSVFKMSKLELSIPAWQFHRSLENQYLLRVENDLLGASGVCCVLFKVWG